MTNLQKLSFPNIYLGEPRKFKKSVIGKINPYQIARSELQWQYRRGANTMPYFIYGNEKYKV